MSHELAEVFFFPLFSHRSVSNPANPGAHKLRVQDPILSYNYIPPHEDPRKIFASVLTWNRFIVEPFPLFLLLIMLFLPSNSIFCFAHQSPTRLRSEFPGKLRCFSARLGQNYKHLSHSVLASGWSQLPAVPLGSAVFDLAPIQMPLPRSYGDYFRIYHHSM